jgi:response regulator of citrate/malate metabolism
MESLECPIRDLRISTARCKSCKELAALLKEAQPHLVLTVPTLPDGTWLEVVKMVSKVSPPANVLVIGSEVDHRLQTIVRDCGGFAYLAPPYEWFPFQVNVRLALRDVKERREELSQDAVA